MHYLKLATMKQFLKLLFFFSVMASISGCSEKQDDYCIKKGPVSALIDGKKYSSEQYTHLHDGQQATVFEQKGVLGFYFETERTIYSSSGDSVKISIRLGEDSIFYTGVKYPIPKTGIINFRRGNYAKLAINQKTDFGFITQTFKAKDGWIEFTDYTEKKDGIYFSGKFQFSIDNKTEKQTEVTDGTFEKIIANY